jgi:hypothetical protein
MFGGHLPESDPFSLSLISNAEVLMVNRASHRNRQVCRSEDHVIWLADAERPTDKYLAFFNLKEEPAEVRFDLAGESLKGQYLVRDLWARRDLGLFEGRFGRVIPAHGAGLYRLSE